MRANEGLRLHPSSSTWKRSIGWLQCPFRHFFTQPNLHLVGRQAGKVGNQAGWQAEKKPRANQQVGVPRREHPHSVAVATASPPRTCSERIRLGHHRWRPNSRRSMRKKVEAREES